MGDCPADRGPQRPGWLSPRLWTTPLSGMMAWPGPNRSSGSAASGSTSGPISPQIHRLPMSFGSTWTHSPAPISRTSGPRRRSFTRSSTSSTSWGTRRRRGIEGCTSTCVSNGAGTVIKCGLRQWRSRASSCVRARPGAQVSTPLRWEEIDQIHPDELTIATPPDRLRTIEDPWEDLNDRPQSLEPMLAMHERDMANGLMDAHWPPVYPKQPGEPPRVSL